MDFMEMPMEFKIDKGIPIPRSLNRTRKWSLSSMEIGDSFFVEAGVALNAIYQAAVYQKVRVLTSRVTENGVRGVRVWRIK